MKRLCFLAVRHGICLLLCIYFSLTKVPLCTQKMRQKEIELKWKLMSMAEAVDSELETELDSALDE